MRLQLTRESLGPAVVELGKAARVSWRGVLARAAEPRPVSRQQMESFEHPKRFEKNARGPFYTMGGCLACDLPESKAPDLLAPLEGDSYETFFVRQPTTPGEVERACEAVEVCCVSDLRYGGCARSIIERLGNSPEFCDYVVGSSGELILSVTPEGDLRPEFAQVVGRQHFARHNRFKASVDGETVTWRLPWHRLDAALPATPARRTRDRRRLIVGALVLAGAVLLWAYARAAV